MAKKTFDKLISYKQRCKGCGICAVACPTSSIIINLNKFGEYQPDVDLTSCVNCGKCKSVCPMETKAPKSKEGLLGSYTKYYLAHSSIKKIRYNCSSGGVVTQLLIDLLNKKEIDGAVCVGFNSSRKPYFSPRICRTVEEIYDCRGSKYYPIEFSSVLNEVKHIEGKFAIVCLPCVATAIKRLKKVDKRFENKIKYVITLTCGHNKTTNYVDYILKYYKLASPYKSISFRNKGNFPSDNYALKAENNNREEIYENFNNNLINKLWCGYYFAQDACLDCRDVFGVDGDLSCMDAWLHPYSKSKAGYNFVIARSGNSKRLLESSENIISKEINLQDVLDSQKVTVDIKSRGHVPNEMLDNVKLSEEYLIEKKELDFVSNRLFRRENKVFSLLSRQVRKFKRMLLERST